jgi:sugar lactone lactonase YvrE
MKTSGIITILFLFALPGRIFSRGYHTIHDLPQAGVTGWELSATFDISGLPRDTYPHFITIFNARWEQVNNDSSGWINIFRRRGVDTSAYGAYGRTFFYSGEDTRYQITLEYSEEISVFFNGKFIYYSGDKGKRTTGSVPLELNAMRGLNELFVFVVSHSSDWKFRISSCPVMVAPEVNHTLTHLLWETESNLLTPESMQYDPQYDLYYVTSYDMGYYTKGSPSGYVTRIDRNGKIIDHQWIKGLFAPTGMCIYKNKLYVTVRHGVIVFDTKKGDYITQYDIPDTEFLNDISVDSIGRIYISDTSRDPDKPDIYIIENEEVRSWYQSEQVSQTNGIYVYRGKLLIGNNGQGLFQSIDLEDKSINTICSLGAGIIDGIRIDNNGNYLVSHWEGKIFRITPQGDITEIFDTRPEGYNAADFEFSGESNTLYIPTFLGDKVAALKLDY